MISFLQGLPFFSLVVAPVALGVQVTVASMFPGNQRVADLAFAILVLLLVEATLHRRIKSHLASVDSILARMVLTAESLDAQHRADKSAIASVNTRVDQTHVKVDALAARVGHVEQRLGITSID